MDDREVIELLSRILSGRIITDPINEAIDLEKSSSSRNARISTGRRRGVRGSEQRKAKTKRKVSGYQKEFGIQLKKLKKKHPRTNISKLMRKAHIATRRKRK
ncbi:MAG: hypothetical protein ACTSQH_08405 [Candidatus Hodarchaeales archaeon]